VDLSKYIWLNSCGCTEPDNEPQPGQGCRCVNCLDTLAVVDIEALVEKAKEQLKCQES